MRHGISYSILAATILLLPTSRCEAAASGPEVNFCELIRTPEQYNNRTIRVRGILAQGSEQSVLYDPTCAAAKTPIAVEFAQHYTGAKRKLNRLVAKNRRAMVVVEGTFYGPTPATLDPKLPDWLKKKLEGTPQRYGHLGAYDSMIRIGTVVSASPATSDTPP